MSTPHPLNREVLEALGYWCLCLLPCNQIGPRRFPVDQEASEFQNLADHTALEALQQEAEQVLCCGSYSQRPGELQPLLSGRS